nr:MAG TPA: hypothetical protein [Caudoviricetes sp.]
MNCYHLITSLFKYYYTTLLYHCQAFIYSIFIYFNVYLLMLLKLIVSFKYIYLYLFYK